MTQIGSPDSRLTPHHWQSPSRVSCLLTLTGTSLLLSLFLFLLTRSCSLFRLTPHPFTCRTYNFNNLNMYRRLQPPPAPTASALFSCHAPPPPSTAAVLLAMGLLGASLFVYLFCCSLTSPCVRHCNGAGSPIPSASSSSSLGYDTWLTRSSQSHGAAESAATIHTTTDVGVTPLMTRSSTWDCRARTQTR